MKGSEMKNCSEYQDFKPPKVTLISYTQDPVNLLYKIWQISKDEEPMMSNDKINQEEARNLFRKIIAQEIPVGENIELIFLLENISIAWREHAVRHRIGTVVNDRIGADIIPDLSSSTFWSQSMRILPMNKFVDRGSFSIPDSVLENKKAKDLYIKTMKRIQDAYVELVDSFEIPMEDARNLIPVGATHRMTWKLNLSSFSKIIGKRSCWILQGGIWAPIIRQMIEEVKKIDPVFLGFSQPPCFSCGEFRECVFKLENERRVSGDDKLPVCPLYLMEGHSCIPEHTEHLRDLKREHMYQELWGIVLKE